MVFGFGFNKAKVLASAEKSVKAGKLQNAIADYERVLKEDPKDLTVMNTVGDLFARVGNSEKAIEYFRKVGEAYANDGFTVKAIAMYKKLTKQDPSALDAVKKLAELYTQQGLYTDARSQYMQLAEASMRNRDLPAAAEMFKRILDLDPENISLQGRLAEIYGKVGRNSEARDLYYRIAVALRAKGALDAADEALASCTKIDPKFLQAVQLRGEIRMETGDPEGAIHALEQLPDIDSRPEGLQALLKAYLHLRNLSEAEPVARKLLKVFNDVSGIADYANALIANGQCEEALHFYRDHADLLFMSNVAKATEVLQSTIARVKSNPKALLILADLFQRSGNTGNFIEVTELLAHAYAADGESEKAAELYRKLIDLEPDNPQHAQNYRQVAKGAAPKPTEREAAPALQDGAATAEEFEVKQPVEQKYAPALQEVIDAALTEADLFESYNMPAKALAPLETALKAAPRDSKINLKLVTLYARCGRLKDAVVRCEVLEAVYRENGLLKDAEQFASVAVKYRQRAGLPPAATPVTEQVAARAEAKVEPEVEHFAEPRATEPARAGKNVEPPARQGAADQTHEFDLSDEWDEMIDVEMAGDTAAAPKSTTLPAAEAPDSVAVHESFDGTEETHDSAISAQSDLLDEIRFYLDQEMWAEARTALGRLQGLAPNLAQLAELQSELARGEKKASSSPRVEVELITNAARPEPASEAKLSAAAAPQAPEPTARVAAADEIGGLVADLETSLGDFELAPRPQAPLSPRPTGEAARPAASIRMAEAARSQSAPAAAITAAAVVEQAPAQVEPQEEAPSMLGDIFTEFKESMEGGTESQEDPETHYNLGVAFKEMGLLDEAIGELQKVCQAIERGHAFPQAMQAYTWLADTFLQKGVPEAAVRWYEKALRSRQIDDETATAIHYELACACEAAGDRPGALKHFMEVYGSNIDYRDVAERIKALKS